ncbi:MAG: cobalamin biosynthesis protein [Lachnospiraceae bacterium]|nr:cobalamin biosynthesis protein [Lachnospiraceae bacterium]
MRVCILSFSIKGCILSDKIELYLEEEGHEVSSYASEKIAAMAGKQPIAQLEASTAKVFYESDAIIFVGSCETAIRAVAPFIRSRVTDPAVVVVDELGQSVVSLLSGQLITSNELAYSIADQVGATPVITNGAGKGGVFSVEAFAKKNHLYVVESVLAREISADLLYGNPVGFECDYYIEGSVPDSLGGDNIESGIFVSTDLLSNPFRNTLHLVPKNIIIGLVCSPGTRASDIEHFMYSNLEKYHIPVSRVGRICSLHALDEEAGITEVADSMNIKYQTYSDDTLLELEGNYSEDDPVGDIFNVDHASERCALRGSHGGKLIIKTQLTNGISMAAAVKKLTIRF